MKISKEQARLNRERVFHEDYDLSLIPKAYRSGFKRRVLCGEND